MSDQLHAMGLAVDQLRRLRRENELLRAKVDTLELCAAFFFGQPPSRGMGAEEDAAHMLEKLIAEEREKRKPAVRPTPAPAPRLSPEKANEELNKP